MHAVEELIHVTEVAFDHYGITNEGDQKVYIAAWVAALDEAGASPEDLSLLLRGTMFDEGPIPGIEGLVDELREYRHIRLMHKFARQDTIPF